tara:strand:+ start:157 stop:405 length:249 start_codon:yes stop_codon:yes gene_type:complete
MSHPEIKWELGNRSLLVGRVGVHVVFTIRAEQLRDDIGFDYHLTFLLSRKPIFIHENTIETLQTKAAEIWSIWYSNLVKEKS